jgi:3-oxoacyl-[acyl-carrier-protein] synthase II
MRAVLTGIGLAGSDLPSLARLWERLDEKANGGTALGADGCDGPQVSERFDPVPLLGRGLRYKDHATRLALLAVDRALTAACALPATESDGEKTAVVASSNFGNLDTVCRTAETIARKSVTGTSPMDLPNASPNVVASTIAIKYRLRGPNVMLCNGSASGLDALRVARLLLSSGRAIRVLVVGTEPADEPVARLLGVGAPRLFDGAAALVLESAQAAAARGAEPLAESIGYARSSTAAESAGQLLAAQPTQPALWLTGARTGEQDTLPVPGGPRGANGSLPRRAVDVEAAVGIASGALGVLQAVAAAHWLSQGGAGTVLATAGGGTDAAASMLFGRVATGCQE